MSDAATKSVQPSGSVLCECSNWCDVNVRHRLLTGHHENCRNSPKAIDKALDLLMLLTNGMERWAADEDGIHPDAWEAYRRAKALEGVALPNDWGRGYDSCASSGSLHQADSATGPRTLDAKWLDPECWPGCQSLVLKSEVEKLRGLYNALINAVERKHPGETRHETALRYILEAEAGATGDQSGVRRRTSN